jgi:phosphohistidine phosphatase
MKTLILCRHAKSDWTQERADIDRPLNDRGANDARQMGTFLSHTGFMPDIIVSSPATRALTTAQTIAKEIKFHSPVTLEPHVYEASTGGLLSLIQLLPAGMDSAMLFGHNPSMEMTVQYLLQSTGSTPMPTGAMAALTFSGTWKGLEPGNVTLNWFFIPRLLRKNGLAGE